MVYIVIHVQVDMLILFLEFVSGILPDPAALALGGKVLTSVESTIHYYRPLYLASTHNITTD